MSEKQANLDFGARPVAVLGVLTGGVIATVVPYVVLVFGANVGFGTVIAAILTLVAVIGGGALAALSVFFGLVIPSKIQARKDMPTKDAATNPQNLE